MQAGLRIFTAMVVAGAMFFAAVPANADTMQEETLVSERVATGDIPVSAPIATIQGHTSELFPEMYDIAISTADGATNTVSVFTGGAVTESFHAELVDLGSIAADVDLSVIYRHDASQQRCLVALNGSCGGKLPLDPTDTGWLVGSPQVDRGSVRGLNPAEWRFPSASMGSGGGAADAALVISATVNVDGIASTTQSLNIPLVGQVVGTTS